MMQRVASAAVSLAFKDRLSRAREAPKGTRRWMRWAARLRLRRNALA